MTSGILLVTHAGIASALLQQADGIIGDPLDTIEVLEVAEQQATTLDELAAAIARADRGQGVLILTDLPCATPANLALKAATDRCRVISGLNLPMLLRAWNYRHEAPETLAGIALEGARRALVELNR